MEYTPISEIPEGWRNNIRSIRQASSLQGTDVAFLLRHHSSHVSRVDNRGLYPRSALDLVGYSVIFNKPIGDLFPYLYPEVEAKVHERAGLLLERLEPRTDRWGEAKKDYIGFLRRRLEASDYPRRYL